MATTQQLLQDWAGGTARRGHAFKREVRAVSATSAIPEAGNPVYSRPVGALGILHRHYHELCETKAVFRGAGTFFVPTDRNIDIRISSTVANGKPGQWEAQRADQGVVRYDDVFR